MEAARGCRNSFNVLRTAFWVTLGDCAVVQAVGNGVPTGGNGVPTAFWVTLSDCAVMFRVLNLTFETFEVLRTAYGVTLQAFDVTFKTFDLTFKACDLTSKTCELPAKIREAENWKRILSGNGGQSVVDCTRPGRRASARSDAARSHTGNRSWAMKMKRHVAFAAVLLAMGLAIPTTALAQTEFAEPEPTPEGCPCACEWEDSSGPFSCDILDFLFFQDAFVAGNPCAIDKDTSTGNGVGDIFDFLVFQQEFISMTQGGC